MNRNNIIALPHQSLRQKSNRVQVFDDALAKLVKNMEDATLDWEDSRAHELGVALAAVQINEHKRVIVIRNNFEDKADKSFLVLVNPKLIRHSSEQTLDYEGCLSVPDLYGLVPRYNKIKLKAQDLNGNEFRLNAEGFLARVLQHEIDHTNGVMFVDHIKGQTDAFYKLDEDGKLHQINYEQIDADRFLW